MTFCCTLWCTICGGVLDSEWSERQTRARIVIRDVKSIPNSVAHEDTAQNGQVVNGVRTCGTFCYSDVLSEEDLEVYLHLRVMLGELQAYKSM